MKRIALLGAMVAIAAPTTLCTVCTTTPGGDKNKPWRTEGYKSRTKHNIPNVRNYNARIRR